MRIPQGKTSISLQMEAKFGCGKETTAELVIRTSLERYGRDRKAVEKMLNRFLSN